eukprot:10336335-Ditylum_brightwellii.AAC.1
MDAPGWAVQPGAAITTQPPPNPAEAPPPPSVGPPPPQQAHPPVQRRPANGGRRATTGSFIVPRSGDEETEDGRIRNREAATKI